MQVNSDLSGQISSINSNKFSSDYIVEKTEIPPVPELLAEASTPSKESNGTDEKDNSSKEKEDKEVKLSSKFLEELTGLLSKYVEKELPVY